jgi:hypothetical protein
MKRFKCLLFMLLVVAAVQVSAQTLITDTSSRSTAITDTTKIIAAADTVKVKKDTVEKHSARKATLRSALLPGWGQAYNKEYWKMPLAWGVVGIPAGLFIYQNTWYRRTRKALEIRSSDTANPPARLSEIHPDLQRLDAQSLRFYRNQFRRDRDYAILYFLIAWGIQVADATVFAHLKDFDVSDDLSFKIKPGYSPLGNTSGISLVLAIKDQSKGKYSLRGPF